MTTINVSKKVIKSAKMNGESTLPTLEAHEWRRGVELWYIWSSCAYLRYTFYRYNKISRWYACASYV